MLEDKSCRRGIKKIKSSNFIKGITTIIFQRILGDSRQQGEQESCQSCAELVNADGEKGMGRSPGNSLKEIMPRT